MDVRAPICSIRLGKLLGSYELAFAQRVTIERMRFPGRWIAQSCTVAAATALFLHVDG